MSEPSMHCISNKHFNFTWSGFEVGNVSRRPSKLLTNQSGSKVAPSRYDQTHQPKMNIFCTLIPPQFPLTGAEDGTGGRGAVIIDRRGRIRDEITQ